PKLALTDLVNTSGLDADGAIAGGPLDAVAIRDFGPEAMVGGEPVTRSVVLETVTAGTTVTADLTIQVDPGLVAATWSNNPSTPGALVDLGSNLARTALPRPPTFDNPDRDPDYAAYRGLAVTPDGRYAVSGSRNATSVVKIDLATMTAAVGL